MSIGIGSIVLCVLFSACRPQETSSLVADRHVRFIPDSLYLGRYYEPYYAEGDTIDVLGCLKPLLDKGECLLQINWVDGDKECIPAGWSFKPKYYTRNHQLIRRFIDNYRIIYKDWEGVETSSTVNFYTKDSCYLCGRIGVLSHCTIQIDGPWSAGVPIGNDSLLSIIREFDTSWF